MLDEKENHTCTLKSRLPPTQDNYVQICKQSSCTSLHKHNLYTDCMLTKKAYSHKSSVKKPNRLLQ